MATACLLDSTVIIDAINDRNGRSELLEGLIAEGTLLACCSINITKVHMGMRPREAERREEFLSSLEFYPVTREIAKYAVNCTGSGVRKVSRLRCRISPSPQSRSVTV